MPKKMKIRYITTDLDFESRNDLSSIIQELGEQALPNHNDWVGKKYFVSLASPSDYNEPEDSISEFCDLIEGLSDNSKKLWQGCTKRVVDVAFESGKIPNNLTCHLSEKLINRLSSLKLSVAITIYPVGHYAHEAQIKIA